MMRAQGNGTPLPGASVGIAGPGETPRGFTLIELLIVVAIIAILAAIAVPNFLEAQTRAKVTRVRADFRSTQTACESYWVDNNAYPFDCDGGIYPADWTMPRTEWQSWVILTTPISYLSSVLENPFRDARTPKNPGSLFEVYEYWGGTLWADSMAKYSIGYRISSVGPDLFRDGAASSADIQSNAPAFLNRLYDPTNGTRSGGDLLCTNYRIY